MVLGLRKLSTRVRKVTTIGVLTFLGTRASGSFFVRVFASSPPINNETKEKDAHDVKTEKNSQPVLEATPAPLFEDCNIPKMSYDEFHTRFQEDAAKKASSDGSSVELFSDPVNVLFKTEPVTTYVFPETKLGEISRALCDDKCQVWLKHRASQGDVETNYSPWSSIGITHAAERKMQCSHPVKRLGGQLATLTEYTRCSRFELVDANGFVTPSLWVQLSSQLSGVPMINAIRTESLLTFEERMDLTTKAPEVVAKSYVHVRWLTFSFGLSERVLRRVRTEAEEGFSIFNSQIAEAVAERRQKLAPMPSPVVPSLPALPSSIPLPPTRPSVSSPAPVAAPAVAAPSIPTAESQKVVSKTETKVPSA